MVSIRGNYVSDARLLWPLPFICGAEGVMASGVLHFGRSAILRETCILRLDHVNRILADGEVKNFLLGNCSRMTLEKRRKQKVASHRPSAFFQSEVNKRDLKI